MYKICIIGAGFSGICVAAQIQTKLKSICDITIFDENSDFGGVWLKNTYPGCACEVPSHLYSFSFEQNPDWSKAYCSQTEILDYLQNVAIKYDLYSKAKFNHKVVEIVWKEIKVKWKVTFTKCDSNTEEIPSEYFDIVINAQGRFTSPAIPEQFHNFKGPVIHSSNWDKNVDIENKVVAVIGTGASGAQIIPAIAEKVSKLFIIQRHSAWVMPKIQFQFPWFIKWSFRNIPGLMRMYRNYLRCLFEINSSAFKIGSLSSKIAPVLAKFNLMRQIKPHSLRQQLTPNYSFGCKRIVLSNEYYSTFNRTNTTLLHGIISEVTDDSIIMDKGRKESVDIIVLATGFQVLNFCDGITVIGKDNFNIMRAWKEDKPSSYLGIVNSSAPNFFILLGPNVSTGYTSLILQLESQVAWVIEAINEMASRKHLMMCVKSSAEDIYMQEIAKKMKNTIYGSVQCGQSKSWYLNKSNEVIEIYPDTSYSYEKLSKTFKREDFDFD